MKLHSDPRKQPLLTPEQLRVISRIPEKARKGTPREEFEKLFRKRVVTAIAGLTS